MAGVAREGVDVEARVASFWSASWRVAASSAAILAARPQVQSLQARRRFPGVGRHSGAVGVRC